MWRFVWLASLGLLVAGCGVGFGSAPESTEVFTRLEAPREVRVGERAVLTVRYDQPYPVDIEVECSLKKGKRTLQILGRATIPGMPGGDPTNPAQTPEAGAFKIDFVARTAGEFYVVCETPADDNNFIARRITVRAPAE